MRKVLCLITIVIAMTGCDNNSPMNYNNSPMNYNNSPMNFNSNNGVYDNNGNRAGYEVKSPSGVTNYFDNNGNRTGYSPSQK